ncbi:PDDEXK family nuclease [Thermococcus profundus]|uniref:hypothetical protein n=1 Tax=Thermococcus profundus TaxID=49899 RepID=UPI0012FD4C5F|nr:hypothetical protein [Thermococcus profundus]
MSDEVFLRCTRTWKKTIALLLGLLILGLTVSSASAAASVVHPIGSQANGNINVPPGVNPGIKPGDGIRPQVWWFFLGLIVLDFAAHWLLEHYVSPDVAAVYDAVSTLIEPEKVAEKLGVKGAKLGIKVISHDKVLIGLFKDNKVVKKFTYASKGIAEWVKEKLGEEYRLKIVEKYVVKDGGLKDGKDFDEIAGTLKKLKEEEKMITNINAIRLIVDRGWDVKKLERVLSDAKSVNNGGKDLVSSINRELKEYATGKRKDLGGHLYEAEIVSHLKRSGWEVEEVGRQVMTSSGKTEIDIIANQGSETVLIECKRGFDGIDTRQITRQAEYAKSHGIKKIKIYYARGPSYPPFYTLQELREIESKYNIEISLVYRTSNFN